MSSTYHEIDCLEPTFATVLPFVGLSPGEICSEVCLVDYDALGITPEDYTSNPLTVAFLQQERQKWKGKKKKFDLSIYLNLPIDLIFEIFGHLHPIDLCSIAQTSKAFGKLVLNSDGSNLLWTCVFDRHHVIPYPPPGVSKPHWASLLFGPSICEECGKYGALVDFAFRRRFCTSCMNQLYTKRTSFTFEGKRYRRKDNILWECSPCSHRYSGWSFHETTYTYRYFKRDIQQTRESFDALRQVMHLGDSRVQQHFEELRTAMTQHAQLVQEHARACTRWASDICVDFEAQEESARDGLERRFLDRLLVIGYTRDDIENRYGDGGITEHFGIHRLTRRVWRELRPKLEKEMAETREARLQAERNARIEGRKAVLEDAYVDYMKSLKPEHWSGLPPSTYLYDSPSFSQHIYDPSDVSLDVSACSHSIPGCLEGWHPRRKEELLTMLRESKPKDTKDEPTPTTLDVATSVFFCRWKAGDGVALFGWDDVVGHSGCSATFVLPLGQINFSVVGSAVAADLVALVGLNQCLTPVSDMDQLDARFLCGRCRKNHHEALTWKECVIHAIRMDGDDEHREQSWHLLTAEAASLVRHHETEFPDPTDEAWSCNHCAEHFDTFVTRKSALHHVNIEHSIPRPVVGVDVVHQLQVRSDHWRTTRRPFVIKKDPRAQYQCKRCPHLLNRLFPTIALRMHLLDKHGIESPVVNEDFVELQVILRTSTAKESG